MSFFFKIPGVPCCSLCGKLICKSKPSLYFLSSSANTVIVTTFALAAARLCSGSCLLLLGPADFGHRLHLQSCGQSLPGPVSGWTVSSFLPLGQGDPGRGESWGGSRMRFIFCKEPW